MLVRERSNKQKPVQAAPKTWTCWRCFRPIGRVQGNEVTIEHHGRRIVAHLPCSQVCHHCRTLNVWDEENGGK